MKDKVFIKLIDKQSGQVSNEVPLSDIIFNQNEIEFQFWDEQLDDYATLPYSDFLFFQDDYDVVVRILQEDKQ